MRNLTIINFTEDARRQYSDVSFRLTESEFILLNNSLGSDATNAVREIFDRIKATGRVAQLIEHSKALPSGQLVNNAIMTALNDTSIKYLTYVGDASSGKVLDAGISILDSYPALACGAKPSLVKTITQHTGMEFIPKEDDLKSPICLETRTVKPSWTIAAPWVMNLDIFRKGSNNVMAFQILSNGFQKAFEQGDVDFEAFFAHVYVAFVQAMRPKFPLLFEL